MTIYDPWRASRRFGRPWWQFWHPMSGLVGGVICGGVVSGAFVAARYLIHKL